MLWLVVGTGVIPFAVAFWRVDRFGRSRPRPTNTRAIVVLGARVLESGEAAPALARRAERGAELHRQGVAPLIIFTGGSTDGLPSEARVARDLAVGLGVPAAACLLEEDSHDTAENAERTTALLRERGIDEIVLVSDDYHLFRAHLRFAEQGIRVQAVASRRTLSRADRISLTTREAFAVLRTPGALLR